MLSWQAETGAAYDLKIAERQVIDVMRRTVAAAPSAKRALLINLGDFFHHDDTTNKTFASGNILDVDSRYPKTCAVGLRIDRTLTDLTLQKHERTIKWYCPGNHDYHTSIMLQICMDAIYENEPRVKVSQDPSLFEHMTFGNSLIAATHGHTIKPSWLPGRMAAEWREEWGATQHHHWYIGHKHHDETKEYPGCVVDQLRALAPKDAFAHSFGYDAQRDLKCDVWHREHGRIGRIIHGVGA